METVPCNKCDFQECEVVRRESEYRESGYILIAKCYGCGKHRVLGEQEYPALYQRIDVIPIDAAPDTVEQRAADRRRYYRARHVPGLGLAMFGLLLTFLWAMMDIFGSPFSCYLNFILSGALCLWVALKAERREAKRLGQVGLAVNVLYGLLDVAAAAFTSLQQ